jgi:uncharacterized phage protein gp47/JayE
MTYDFESILLRLKEQLSGRVSAMEGTFAGDILQAVAAELARIWSQEMDSVTQRAFLTTAEGQWLDAACGDYGIVRKEGESDEQLRKRALDRIRQRGSSGNAADYVAWAQEVEGVALAAVVPLGRGAGTVDVYFSPTEGAPPNILLLLQHHLEDKRPVGADVKVIQALPVTVGVTAKVKRQGDVSLEDIQQTFTQKLTDYLQQAKMAEGGQVVSINRIIGLLVSCPGVEDVHSLDLNGGTVNLTMEPGTYAVTGAVSLTEV